MENSIYTKKNNFILEIFIWLIFAIIWFGPLGNRALFHTDEGRYATIALNTLFHGDWITPRLNGILYFEKPILQYWGSALIFKFLGISEFTARLYPAITGFLTVILVSCTARRLWGKAEGQLAAIICGSMAWIIGNSHILTLDMGMTFFLSLALCSFLLALHDNSSPKEKYYWMLTVWVAMAFATLSKGLIGILIPSTSLFLYCIINRQFKILKNLQWLRGLILLFVICAPWFVVVCIKNPSFFHFFFIHEHFQRFLTTTHHRTGAIWYFVPILLAGAIPWTTWLPSVFMNGWRDKTRDNLGIQRFLLIWSLFIFLFFSKSSSKLPSYILPMFPAIALMLAWHLNRVKTEIAQKHLIFPFIIGIIFIISHPLAKIIGLRQDILNYLSTSYTLLFLSGFVMIACYFLAKRYLLRENVKIAMLCLGFGTILALTIGSYGADNYLSKFKSSRDIIPQIAPYLKNDTTIFSVRYYDQTFPFYLRRNIILVDYVNEFEFGENQEPDIWIPKLNDFIPKWNKMENILAITNLSTYEELLKQNIPMKVLFRDSKRVVIGKP